MNSVAIPHAARARRDFHTRLLLRPSVQHLWNLKHTSTSCRMNAPRHPYWHHLIPLNMRTSPGAHSKRYRQAFSARRPAVKLKIVCQRQLSGYYSRPVSLNSSPGRHPPERSHAGYYSGVYNIISPDRTHRSPEPRPLWTHTIRAPRPQI